MATGPDEYLFGEETALLEVVDGRAPFPRIAPPYRRGVVELVEHDDDVDSGSGLAAHVEMASPGHETGAPPALIGNVETMANVPAIIQQGADWFREHGTAQSPGTIVCTVTGDVARPAVGEIALGTTVRAAIDEVAGGLSRSRVVRAVLCGVSAGPLPPELLDTPLTYEDMAQAGSGLGTASLIVVCEGADMTAVAAGAARFLAVESCGQCTPCKRDGLVLAEALERLCAGQGQEGDLDTITSALRTIADGARCNLASQQQAVVGRILHRWPDEPAAHAVAGASGGTVEPLLVSEVVELADGEVTLDIRRRTKQPDWTHHPGMVGFLPRRPARGPPPASAAGLTRLPSGGLRGQDLRGIDLRRRGEQAVGVGHEGLGDRAVQMRLALGLSREGIDDPERRRVGAQGEPHRGALLGVRQLDGAGEELGELVLRLGLGGQLDDECNGCHATNLRRAGGGGHAAPGRVRARFP